MRIKIALGLIFCAVVTIFLGHEALVMLLSIIITYIVLDSTLSKSLFNSVLLRIFITLFGYFTILQTVIMTCWLASHNFPLNYCLEVTFVLLVASVGVLKFLQYKKRRAPESTTRVPFIRRTDIYGLAIGSIIFILLVGGPIVKSYHTFGHHIEFSSVVIDSIDTSLDDSNHLGRVNDRIQLNRGVLYETNVTKEVVNGDSISTYPPAWHSANALAIKAVDPKITVGGQNTIAYVITKLLWTLVMVYLFVRATFILADLLFSREKRKTLNIISDLFILGVTGFLAYYSLLEQYQEGFYPFIPLIISLMLLVPLLVQLSIDKDSKLRPYRAFLPLVIALANLTLSWFLLMPAVLVAISIALFFPMKKKGLGVTLIALWRESIAYFPILAFALLGVIVQLVIITAPTSQTFSVGVNTPGALVIHSNAYFIFIIIGLIAGFLLSKQYNRLTRYVGALLVSMLGFSFFIYLFQVATVHGPQYYYYKTLDAFILCATPLAVIGWIWIVRKVFERYDTLASVFIVIGVLIAIPIVIGIEPPNDALLSYIHGNGRSIDPNEAAYIYDSINERAKVPLPNRISDVIVFEPGDVGENIVGTNILRSIQPINQCDNVEFTDLLNDNEQALFQTIKSCQTAPLTIVTQPNSYAALVREDQAFGLGGNIKITEVK